MALSQPGIGFGVVRADLYRFLKKIERALDIGVGVTVKVSLASKQAIISCQIVWWVGVCKLQAGLFDSSHQSRGYRTRHLFLYCKDILEVSIVALGPDVVPRTRLDQLCCNSHVVAGPADAAFEHVANTELIADFPDVSWLSFVCEGGMARYYEQ